MASIAFVRTVSFSIYQKAKYKYSAAIGQATGNEEPLVVVNRPGSIPTFQTVLCFGAAGATAGGLIAGIACKSRSVALRSDINNWSRSFRIDEASRPDICSHGQ